MTFPTTIDPTQENKETPISEMFLDLTPFALGSHDPVGTSGLTFGVHGGPMAVDGVLTTIADQTTLLAASSTNYVEWTRAGVLSDNASGFTAGRIPLYVVTTNAAGVASFIDWRVWQALPGVAGRVSVAVTTADVTLSAAEARCNVVNVTGTLTGNRALIVPAGPQQWTVVNNTSGAFTLTVKTAAGSGTAVTQGKAALLLADGTNVVAANNDTAGSGGGLLAANNLSDVASATTAAANLQGSGLDVDLVGFRGLPINSQSGNYTTVAADSGKLLLHPSGAGAADTFTIDSNANVAYEIGAAISFCNMDSNALSIAITTDTLTLAGAGTTGTRSLAQYGIGTAVKITTTGWLISGTNLT